MNNQNHNFKFKGKIIITADIKCITGLHIGGTEEGFEIGGIDNVVIKDPLNGIPYIPGSSLKGKMRSLLEWVDKCYDGEKSCVEIQVDKWERKRKEKMKELQEKEMSKEEIEKKLEEIELSVSPCECGRCDVCIIFGSSAASPSNEGPTRLTIRDAYPKGFIKDDGTRDYDSEQIKKWEAAIGEGIYTELKTENTIDRITSAANPRTIERVPADSVFTVEMIFDLYKEDDKQKLKNVFQAMSLLEDSYLGGGGSRGSGKIKFENIKVIERSIYYYEGKEQSKEIVKDKDLREILQNFDEFFK